MEHKYQRIVDAIARDINAGKYAPHCPIPSERILMSRHGVARETVRKALDVLGMQGLIVRKQGCPTVVAEHAAGTEMKIGVMISGCLYTEIYKSISASIKKLGDKENVEVIVGDLSRDEFDRSGSAVYRKAHDMIAKGVRGVVLQPMQFSRIADTINRNLVEIFQSAGVAVVLIDCDVVRRPGRGEFDLIGIDNYNAGRLAAEHAIDRGARKILFAALRGCADTIHERWYGVRSVSERAKVAGLYVKAFSDLAHVRQELTAIGKLDTIICQNDIAALNVMRALQLMGLHVPNDVMVIGFDDVALAGKSRPGLTSVHQPCSDIAEQAYRRLLLRIANPSLRPISIQCRESLAARGSTDRTW